MATIVVSHEGVSEGFHDEVPFDEPHVEPEDGTPYRW